MEIYSQGTKFVIQYFVLLMVQPGENQLYIPKVNGTIKTVDSPEFVDFVNPIWTH